MDSEKCLAPECGRDREIRGLCTSCYHTANRMIRNGEATETELINKGLLLPANPGGRPASNPLRRAVESGTRSADGK